MSDNEGSGAICLILAAGFSKIEEELASGSHALPKALLPVAGKAMLDYWWDYISQNRTISEVFILVNTIRYKHFERWATSKGVPINRVINTGVSSAEHSHGALCDVELGLVRAKQLLGESATSNRDLVLLAGDALFYRDFDLGAILAFRAAKNGNLLLYYQRTLADHPKDRGMCDVNPHTRKVTGFVEKPDTSHPGAKYPFVCPLFYILTPQTWQGIPRFNAESGRSKLSVGTYIESAINDKNESFWGMRMPGAFFMVGSLASQEEYARLDAEFSSSGPGHHSKPIECRSYARVGIVGNPSDGFFGKTIAMTIKNFWATVELWESDKLVLMPHPLYDPCSFGSLAELHYIGRREGYYGGTRLLMATCKKFFEACTLSGIALPRKNFTVRYDTNVPRQVGLSGSSAIITSLWRCLMSFYGLTDQEMSLELQPSLIRNVEMDELGIQCGLQDRVVQVYQGLVYMDFNKEYMTEHGHGRYERLSFHKKLPFFIAFEADPSDSGKIHNKVRQRFDEGDPEVLNAMKHFAELTDRAREAILKHDIETLAQVMEENFTTRRNLYGDACLGVKNLEMIAIGQAHGAAVKFPGSGGAILGLCRPNKATMEELRIAYEAAHFVFCPIDMYAPDQEITEDVPPAPSSSPVAWPLQLEQNRRMLGPSVAPLADMLVMRGQSHLFSAWGPPGVDDEEKRVFFSQMRILDDNYPGGIAAYLTNAKELLIQSQNGVNPLKGLIPSVPRGMRLEFGTQEFETLEERGLQQIADCAFVLVAGGLGERLGFSGIKVSMPVSILSGTCYLEWYCKSILALQKRSKASKPLPLAIMTSGDTDELTRKLLKENGNFGLDQGQVHIIKQEKVPCLADPEARLATDGMYGLQTKPHGHGDVHSLLHRDGLVERWGAEGRRWILFFQDTNAFVFRSLPAFLASSNNQCLEMSFLTVPRRAKTAVGAIVELASRDTGKTVVANVEYNQLDPLLRDSVSPDGDTNASDGFSPYPGNTNQLLIKLQPYSMILKKSQGAMPEFVNPKYRDDSKKSFKSSTRLECMMQDYAFLLDGPSSTGFTLFPHWFAYSPVKNSPAEAVQKAKTGHPQCPTSGEMDIFQFHSRILQHVGAKVAGCVPKSFLGLQVDLHPRVIWEPNWACCISDVRARLPSPQDVSISVDSTLVLDGDIVIESLYLEGALIVKACPGAHVILRSLRVVNEGWCLEPTSDLESDEILRIRGFMINKKEAREINLTTPGEHIVSL